MPVPSTTNEGPIFSICLYLKHLENRLLRRHQLCRNVHGSANTRRTPALAKMSGENKSIFQPTRSSFPRAVLIVATYSGIKARTVGPVVITQPTLTQRTKENHTACKKFELGFKNVEAAACNCGSVGSRGPW